MNYVTYYTIGSLIFLSITFILYLTQNKIPNKLSLVFKIMLISGICAVICDLLSATFNGNPYNLPVFILYIINFVFVIGMQICLPLFYIYILIYVGTYSRLSKKRKILMLIPFAIIVILTISSFLWTNGIFYLDSKCIYHRGLTNHLLYLSSLFYVVLSVIAIVKYRNSFLKSSFVIICIAGFVLILALILQFLFPSYLLTTTGMSVCLVVMYNVLQAPTNYIEPITDVYNRVALPLILQDLYERHPKFKMILFSSKSLNHSGQLIEPELQERILNQLTKLLKTAFPKQYLFHIYYSEFVVLNLTDATCEQLMAIAPKEILIDKLGSSIPLDISIFNSNDFKNPTEIINTMDYIIHENFNTLAFGTSVISSEHLARCQNIAILESKLATLIDYSSIGIKYHLIKRIDKSIGGIEVHPYIKDPMFNDIEDSLLIKMVEQNGYIQKLTKIIIQKVAITLQSLDLSKNRIKCIGISLSPVFCTIENIGFTVNQSIKDLNINPSNICFVISEAKEITSKATFKDNIEYLHNNGFLIALDDFGSGYTNMSAINSFPFQYVKIDESLLQKAMKSQKQASLLLGIRDVIKRLNLTPIIKGVNDDLAYDFITEHNIQLYQGSYKLETMDEEQLISYFNQ